MFNGGDKSQMQTNLVSTTNEKEKKNEGRVPKKVPITALIYFYYFFAEVQNQGKGECL